MSTELQARTAQQKLRERIGDHAAVNGIGLTWDAQGNWVVYLVLLKGADTTGLTIPTSVDSVAVTVETLPSAEAFGV